MFDDMEQLEHIDDSSHLEAAQTRIGHALHALEQRVETLLKQAHSAAKLKEENAALKAEREELKKNVHTLTAKNEKLSSEIKRVSTRLDAAIEKIGRVLES